MTGTPDCLQVAEQEAGEDEEMAVATAEEELHRQAAERDAAYSARKKAKLDKPNAANDKGISFLTLYCIAELYLFSQHCT